MSKPLVSVIVPTYNVERYVEDCIDSLIRQTYPNVEIIVIDDGSKDATVYLLNQYKDKIHLIAHDNNKGQGARRNEGLALASGKYIYFVDSDDWIEPETIEEAVDQLEKTGADLVRFNGKSFADNNNISINENNYNFKHQLHENTVYGREKALQVNRTSFNASPCLYIIKEALIANCQIEFPEGILHEDEYFTTILFLNIDSMIYINKAFYHRRYRSSSTMTDNTRTHVIKSFNSYIKIFELLETVYLKSKLDESQKVFLKRQMLSIYNGLRLSPITPQNKRMLKNLKSISLKDRMFVAIAHLKQQVFWRK